MEAGLRSSWTTAPPGAPVGGVSFAMGGLSAAGALGAMGAMGGPGASDPVLSDRQRSFSAVLGRWKAEPGETPERSARRAAEAFVSSVLVKPVLAQVRGGSWAAEPFKPNQAEQMFRGMLDEHLAGTVTSSLRFGLVDRIAADLLRARGATAQPGQPGPAAAQPGSGAAGSAAGSGAAAGSSTRDVVLRSYLAQAGGHTA